jgi:hypothetical protein
MDSSISGAPRGKAAAAGTRAKRAVLAACVALASVLYVSEERSHAAARARLYGAQPEIQKVVARLAAQPGDPAAVAVRNFFYDKKDGVYCGELDSRTSRGAEVRFKDGVRIFVCGPGVDN